MTGNSPIDRVIGVRWGLSPHASFSLLTASKKNCKVYLILVKMSPGNHTCWSVRHPAVHPLETDQNFSYSLNTIQPCLPRACSCLTPSASITVQHLIRSARSVYSVCLNRLPNHQMYWFQYQQFSDFCIFLSFFQCLSDQFCPASPQAMLVRSWES